MAFKGPIWRVEDNEIGAYIQWKDQAPAALVKLIDAKGNSLRLEEDWEGWCQNEHPNANEIACFVDSVLYPELIRRRDYKEGFDFVVMRRNRRHGFESPRDFTMTMIQCYY